MSVVKPHHPWCCNSHKVPGASHPPTAIVRWDAIKNRDARCDRTPPWKGKDSDPWGEGFRRFGWKPYCSSLQCLQENKFSPSLGWAAPRGARRSLGPPPAQPALPGASRPMAGREPANPSVGSAARPAQGAAGARAGRGSAGRRARPGGCDRWWHWRQRGLLRAAPAALLTGLCPVTFPTGHTHSRSSATDTARR